eukprot:CAMPEP_0204322756 /NCGR_PEP_ID=MMETSP0469-20131031/8874_1 /ASSEMBLY_ACC=CAM_ASM_000384 /TAXON_ID=2969 /ORGANISM="Oxyrrhis marina" /LENGTH=56 /DNA_ID=CAMNT_0051304123 /DNA_START=49 /DNA_END=215 /DNA_ORIENTATION=-
MEQRRGFVGSRRAQGALASFGFALFEQVVEDELFCRSGSGHGTHEVVAPASAAKDR